MDDINERRKIFAEALNKSLGIIVSESGSDIGTVLTHGLRPIADASAMDQIVVFRLLGIGNERHFGQVYRWAKEDGGTTTIFEEMRVVPDHPAVTNWIEICTGGNCVNIHISIASDAEAAFLTRYGLQSLLLSPILIKGELWGAIAFQDHTTERYFDDLSIEFLSSSARICANVFIIDEAAQALKRSNELAVAINKISELLLVQSGKDFKDITNEAGYLLAGLAEVDRFSLTRNTVEDGVLYMSQIFRWERASGGTTKLNENFVHAAYRKTAPNWEQMFNEGKSLNGPVRLMPERESAVFKGLGTKSALAAPIQINGIPWGFALFEDQQKERYFDEELSKALQSAAFLFINAVLRAELENTLAAERGKALQAEQMRVLIDALPFSCTLIDKELNVLTCNKTAIEFFRLSIRDDIQRLFVDLMPEYQPDGRNSKEIVVEVVRKAFDEGYSFVEEWTHKNAGGELLPSEMTLVRVEYGGNYVVAVYVRDMRSVKEAEAKIYEADERAQIMLEQTPLVVMLWDKDANILDCNEEAVRVTGLSSKKEYVERLFELTPDLPDGTTSSQAARKAIALCLETGSCRIPWALHHAVTGELIPFDVTIARVKYKGEDVVISYAQDMRERNAAIEKIREADDRARVMIEQAPLVVMLWDKDAHILDCNQEALGILGLSSKQEYMERFFELTPDLPNGMTSLEAAKMLIATVLKTGFHRHEWVLTHAETGEAIPFDSTLARIKYKDEYIVMSYGLDVRERNTAIAKMREADERVHLMTEYAPVILMLWDKNFQILDCNQEAVRVFGVSDKKEYMERFFEFVPEYQPGGIVSQEMFLNEFTKVFNETGYTREEWTMHHAVTGEAIPFEVTLVRIKYKDEYAVLSYAQDLRELKAATKLLMEKTSMLTAILDTASDLIFVKDLNSRYIQCNKSFESLMGCSCDDIIGKGDAEGLNTLPEVEAAFVAEDKKIFDNKQTVSFEDYIVAADGTKVFFETTKSPLIIDGKMTGLVGVARDMTKRKEMEKELLRQHSLMHTVNAAAAVLLEPDRDGGFNSINHSMEMVCQKLGADRVYLWENVRKSKGESNYRQIYKWISPEYCIDNNLAEFSYENTLPFWNSLFSERKSLNGPIDTFPDAERNFLSQYNIQSILAVPLFFKEGLWGFVSFDDCQNRRCFSKADEHTLNSWGLLVIGAIQRGKIMLDLEHAVEQAKASSSKAMKAYAEVEAALEAKGRFIANMNHEMRTPMNVIVGLTDLMLEESDVPGKAKETLHKINIAGTTLMGLISDILDISKVEAGKMNLMPVRYHVASMLNDIIALNSIRAEDKPVVFKLDINEDIPASLFGDDLRVKQILNNLLSNAFKYTKEGTVTLGVDCQWDGRRHDGYVWVSFYIRDTGIGIRKEDVAKLFTDYNQVDTRANREIEGTGLGLSITKKFVDLMDGEISVESEYGKGSTFRVRIRQGFIAGKSIGKETVESLSTFRYSDERMRAQKKLVRSDLSSVRVLVVDDFPTNLDVAAGMLRKYKMQVDCVTSGQESIELIAAGEPVYDAIFMDHMMPGMDGVEAAKAIRAIGNKYAKDIPIIALTANAVAESERMFLANGFNAFLPKPFNVMSLDSIVQRWVKHKNRG